MSGEPEVKSNYDVNLEKFMSEMADQIIDGAIIIHTEISTGDAEGEIQCFYVPHNLNWIVFMHGHLHESVENFSISFANFTESSLHLLSPFLVNAMKEVRDNS